MTDVRHSTSHFSSDVQHPRINGDVSRHVLRQHKRGVLWFRPQRLCATIIVLLAVPIAAILFTIVDEVDRSDPNREPHDSPHSAAVTKEHTILSLIDSSQAGNGNSRAIFSHTMTTRDATDSPFRPFVSVKPSSRASQFLNVRTTHLQPPSAEQRRQERQNGNVTVTTEPSNATTSGHVFLRNTTTFLESMTAIEISIAWSAAWNIVNVGGNNGLATPPKMPHVDERFGRPAVPIKVGTAGAIATKNQHWVASAFVADIVALDTRYAQMALSEARARSVSPQEHKENKAYSLPSPQSHAKLLAARGNLDKIMGSLQPHTPSLKRVASSVSTPQTRGKYSRERRNARDKTEAAKHPSSPPYFIAHIRESVPTHLSFAGSGHRWFWEELFGVRGYDHEENETVLSTLEDVSSDENARALFDPRRLEEYYSHPHPAPPPRRLTKENTTTTTIAANVTSPLIHDDDDDDASNGSGFDGTPLQSENVPTPKLFQLEAPFFQWYGWKQQRVAAKDPLGEKGKFEQRNKATAANFTTTAGQGDGCLPCAHRLQQRALGRHLMRLVLPAACRTSVDNRRIPNGNGRDSEGSSSFMRHHPLSPPCAPIVMMRSSSDTANDKSPSNLAIADSVANTILAGMSAPTCTLVPSQAFALRKVPRKQLHQIDAENEENRSSHQLLGGHSSHYHTPQSVFDVAIPSLQIRFDDEGGNNTQLLEQRQRSLPLMKDSVMASARRQCEAVCRRLALHNIPRPNNASFVSDAGPTAKNDGPVLRWICAGFRPTLLEASDSSEFTNASTDSTRHRHRGKQSNEAERASFMYTAAATVDGTDAKTALTVVCEFFSVESLRTMGWRSGADGSGTATLVRTSDESQQKEEEKHSAVSSPLRSSSFSFPSSLTAALSRTPPLPFESSVTYGIRTALSDSVVARNLGAEEQQKSSFLNPPKRRKISPPLFSLQHHHLLSRLVCFGVIANDRYLPSRVTPMLDTWLRRWDAYLLFEDYYAHRGDVEDAKRRGGGGSECNKNYDVKKTTPSRAELSSEGTRGPPTFPRANGTSSSHGLGSEDGVLYNISALGDDGLPKPVQETFNFPFVSNAIENYLWVPAMKARDSTADIAENSPAKDVNYVAAERIDVATRVGAIGSPLSKRVTPLSALFRFLVWTALNEVYGLGRATQSMGYRMINPTNSAAEAEEEARPSPPMFHDAKATFRSEQNACHETSAKNETANTPSANTSSSAPPVEVLRARLIATFARYICRMTSQYAANGQKLAAADGDSNLFCSWEKNQTFGAHPATKVPFSQNTSRSRIISCPAGDDVRRGRLVVPGTKLMMRSSCVCSREEGVSDASNGRMAADGFHCGPRRDDPCTMPLGFVRPLFTAEPRPTNNLRVHGRGGAWKNYPLLLLMLRAEKADEAVKSALFRKIVESRRRSNRDGQHNEDEKGATAPTSNEALSSSESDWDLLTPSEEVFFTRRQFFVVVDDDTYFIHRNLVAYLTYFVPTRLYMHTNPLQEDEGRDEGDDGAARGAPLLALLDAPADDGEKSTNFSSFVPRVPPALSGGAAPLPLFTGELHEQLRDPLNPTRVIHGGAGALMNRPAAERIRRSILAGDVIDYYADLRGYATGNCAASTEAAAVHADGTLGKSEDRAAAPFAPNDPILSSIRVAASPPKTTIGAAMATFYRDELAASIQLRSSAKHSHTKGTSDDELPPTSLANQNLLFLNLSAGVCAHPRHQISSIFGDVWLSVCAMRLAHIEPTPNTLFSYMTPFSAFWVAEKFITNSAFEGRNGKEKGEGHQTAKKKSLLFSVGGDGSASSKFPLSFHNIRSPSVFYELHKTEEEFEQTLVRAFNGRSFVCTARRGDERERNAQQKESERALRDVVAGVWHAEEVECRPKSDDPSAESKASIETSHRPTAHLPSAYVAHIPLPWSSIASLPATREDMGNLFFKQFAKRKLLNFGADLSFELKRALFFKGGSAKAAFRVLAAKWLESVE